MGQALSAPVINDVSTNLEDPPVFTRSQHPAALPDHVKRACSKAYGHLQPLVVPGGSSAEVFAAARRAAGALPRASVVHEDAGAGVLELLDVTRLMRFKDDVAVRVRQVPGGGGSGIAVDVRSASRLGKGDLGANAARIDTYLAALWRELGLPPAGQS